MRQRCKEISLRKVLGASTASVVGLLTRDILTLVAVACGVATPVALWLGREWLNTFAYAKSLSPWVFLVACGGSVLVAVVTVGAQVFRIAGTDPASVLQSE